MPKLKTKKCIAKRVRITKTGKLIVRQSGQDHFNARESGKTTRGKRRDRQISKTIARNIKRVIN